MRMADITAWALRTLKQRYGYDSFRGRQLDVITAILGHRDVLAVMPTGAGKSLCYQIPACAPGRNGVPALVLVITPLRALMRDQVAHLTGHGIPAAFIDSETTEDGRREIYTAAREGRIRLLYVAPERLSTQGFLRFAQSVRIRLLAVDEAHCVFQWGQDFRPDYLGIASFVDRLPERPVVAAFTASATPDVRDGIVRNLRLHDPQRIVTSFDRPNLYFRRREVHAKTERDDIITDYALSHRGESGIVYCTSRARTEELAEVLKTAGINAEHFHARMDERLKIDVQNAFLDGSLDVIVATTAFGMGVDKPDVRWVINDGLPSSLEEYYQEAGRAGRDGKPASCLLLWGRHEFEFRRQCIEESAGSALDAQQDREKARKAALERCSAMERYCTTSGCLRAYMLRYFGEEPLEKRCGTCDSCTGRSSLHRGAGAKRACRKSKGISSFDAVSTYGYADDWNTANISDITDTSDTADKATVTAALAFIRNIHDAQGTGYSATRIVNALHGSHSAAVTDCGLDAVAGYGSLPDTSGAVIRAAIRQLLDDGTVTHGTHGTVLPADVEGD